MKTAFVPCALVGTAFVVWDVITRRRHRVEFRAARVVRVSRSVWCVEAEVLDRSGPRCLVRLPSGDECWVEPLVEAA